MIHKFLLLGLVLMLCPCCKEKQDFKPIEIHGLIPCRIGVNHNHGTSYEIEFYEMVLVMDTSMKTLYDDFEFNDLYLVHMRFEKDSLTQKITGEIKFDLDNSLILIADTINKTSYKVGDFVYKNYSIENIESYDDSLSFDIKLPKTNGECYVINSGLYYENNTEYLMIEKDFIGKLYDERNPIFYKEVDNKYYLKTVKSPKDKINMQLTYYKNQLNDLRSTSVLKNKDIYTTQYLQKLIELISQ